MEKQNACTTTKGKMLAKLARLFFFSRDLWKSRNFHFCDVFSPKNP
jgi:hypothetical protein